MSVAHQEAVGMAVVTAVFALILLLSVLYRRRTGERSPWFFPSLLLVLVGIGLTVVTANGGVLSGL